MCNRLVTADQGGQKNRNGKRLWFFFTMFSTIVVWSHMVTGPLTKCCVQWISIHAESSHMRKYNKSMVVSVWSAMVFWFCVGPTSKRWFFKIVQVTMKHDPFELWCHVGIHVDFNIHLAVTYFVGPSSVVWSELGSAPPFPPMRVLEVYW